MTSTGQASGGAPARTLDRELPAFVTPLTLFAVGLVIALCFAADQLRDAWFFLDDFRNLGRARADGLGWHFLTSPVGEHFAPGHHLIDWIVAEPLGFEWKGAVAVELAFLAGAAIGTYALLNELFGRRPLHAALAIFLSCSVSALTAAQWFAGGAHALPGLCFTCISLAFFARWSCRERSRTDFALALLAMVVGLLFWVQVVLVPVFALMIVAFVRSEALTLRSIGQTLRIHAPLIGAQLLLLLCYLLFLKTRSYAPKVETPGLHEALDLVRIMVSRELFTSIAGTSIPIRDPTHWERFAQLLGFSLLVGGLLWSLITRRCALRGLLILVTGVLGTAGTIWAGRLAVLGPNAGAEQRYLLPLSLVLVLAVATAARRPQELSDPGSSGARVKPLPVAIAAIALLAYGAAVNRNFNHNHFAIDEGRQARALTDRLDVGIDAARKQGWMSGFVDVSLPSPLWYGTPTDENNLSTLAPAFATDMRVVGSTNPLLVVDINGFVSANVFRPVATSEGRSVARNCSGSCSLTLRPLRPTRRANAFVLLNATSADPVQVEVTPSARASQKEDPTTRTTVAAGGQRVVPTWSAGVSSVAIAARSSGSFRLRASIGTLEPVARRSRAGRVRLAP